MKKLAKVAQVIKAKRASILAGTCLLLVLGHQYGAIARTLQQVTTPQPTAPAMAPEIAGKLVKVKRIYVESFGEDPVSRQLHAMVVDAMNQTHRFILTENKERADAILRGSALEKTNQELHSISEGSAAAAAGGASSSTLHGDSGSVQGSSHSAFGALDLATSDAQSSTVTINDARLAVRLVAADGDVLWSTTQESKGAKYKGASADVADRIAKQLLRDIDKLQTPKDQKETSPDKPKSDSTKAPPTTS